ncbi:BA14K family protein [Mesorhizobium sp. IMUNJ 23232]|uniref:BA14K family protein n=1 Tax=Mesorhizobium sp. IMUNJ 23232 TaxID=3376064 RepID=UPI0037A06FB9
MSMFLTGLSGFVATLAIAAGAIYVTEGKHRAEWRGGSGSSWTGEASAASAQPLKRVAAKPSFNPPTVVKHPEVPSVDMIKTGTLADQKTETVPEPAPDQAATMAHVQWCSERYRSYRPEDNSYRSYSGSQRECVSPFTSGSRTREEEEVVDHADIGIDRPHARYAVEEGTASFLTPRHIASCFARYRSYSPENNSYQPYGGGSRRQCE